MAIHFRCACGKQMNAKDEFAGRRYRCPKCEKVVRIPTPKARQTPAKTDAPAPPNVKPAGKSAPAAPALAKPAAPQGVARPVAPLARPVATAPLARPVPASQRPTTTAARPHPWEDRSLVQTPTPWLPGDEARFQAGVKLPREGLVWWEKLALVVVVIVAGAAAIVAAQVLS